MKIKAYKYKGIKVDIDFRWWIYIVNKHISGEEEIKEIKKSRYYSVIWGVISAQINWKNDILSMENWNFQCTKNYSLKQKLKLIITVAKYIFKN